MQNNHSWRLIPSQSRNNICFGETHPLTMIVIVKSDVMWCGVSFSFSAFVCCVPSQLLVHIKTTHWGGSVRNKEGLCAM